MEYLKGIQKKIRNASKESLEMSLADVHAPGMFSLVFDGTVPGELTRAFVAHKKLKPFKVQLHTHRYPIRLTVLKGVVRNHVAVTYPDPKRLDVVQMQMHEYKSPLNGGEGLVFDCMGHVGIAEYVVPPGGSIDMNTQVFHTLSCSKGAIWVVEEYGFEEESSWVLGAPFILDGLYNKPEMFQINDNHQLVLKAVNKLLAQ